MKSLDEIEMIVDHEYEFGNDYFDIGVAEMANEIAEMLIDGWDLLGPNGEVFEERSKLYSMFPELYSEDGYAMPGRLAEAIEERYEFNVGGERKAALLEYICPSLSVGDNYCNVMKLLTKVFEKEIN